MSFGGFFGGGGNSSKDSSSSNSTSPSSSSSAFPSSPFSSSPSATNISSSSSSSNPNSESSQIKSRLITAISTQSNVANAKQLISQVNSTCFEHCVPYPGSSLSGKEQNCLSACMEKYIEGWNAVSKSYIGRLQREGVNMRVPGGGPPGGEGESGGKELF